MLQRRIVRGPTLLEHQTLPYRQSSVHLIILNANVTLLPTLPFRSSLAPQKICENEGGIGGSSEQSSQVHISVHAEEATFSPISILLRKLVARRGTESRLPSLDIRILTYFS